MLEAGILDALTDIYSTSTDNSVKVSIFLLSFSHPTVQKVVLLLVHAVVEPYYTTNPEDEESNSLFLNKLLEVITVYLQFVVSMFLVLPFRNAQDIPVNAD